MSVLGLCTLISRNDRPGVLNECVKEILPSMVLLFDGLKRAYAGMYNIEILPFVLPLMNIPMADNLNFRISLHLYPESYIPKIPPFYR